MKEFKFAFKCAAGAYLGWQVCRSLDQNLGKRLAPKAQAIIEKLNEKAVVE